MLGDLSFTRDPPLARAAVAFASERHAGQRRQSDGADFVLHPIEVGALLQGPGASGLDPRQPPGGGTGVRDRGDRATPAGDYGPDTPSSSVRSSSSSAIRAAAMFSSRCVS